MMQLDFRVFIWVGGIALLAYWFIGGLLFSARGRWLDRGRVIELHQFGPVVWGLCAVEGGSQRYFGGVFRGELSLARRDFGKRHLQQLGFTAAQASTVEGQVMVRLKLVLNQGDLVGYLWGTRFQFNQRTQNVISAQATQAEERHWIRG